MDYYQIEKRQRNVANRTQSFAVWGKRIGGGEGTSPI